MHINLGCQLWWLDSLSQHKAGDGQHRALGGSQYSDARTGKVADVAAQKPGTDRMWCGTYGLNQRKGGRGIKNKRTLTLH